MNKQKKLLIQRTIFLFIVFVSLGVIIVTEKAGTIMIPKINKKITTYINDNYSDIKDTIKRSKLTYKNTKYTTKITNNTNKNHYFYIYYQNKKIKDTYKKDYLEGKNLLTHIKKKLEKEILKETNTNVKVKIISKLNEYTSTVQERLLKEEDLLNLKFYNIEKELLIENWNSKEISTELSNTIKKYNDDSITPKYYILIINNKSNLKESITIKLTEDFLINNEKELIIEDIINDKENSKLLKKYSITYKYK